jgi:ATP-dependent DNA helicase RecG
MELVEGDLFQMADQAIAFISRHLNHGAGVHSHGAAADDVDEIPNSVIAEAVNNAIAHRNYASIGSIQVEVYSDRVEVISPGQLHRAITVADLYKKHESFATNPRIARAMYQVKYIEKFGTGFTDLLDGCKSAGLPVPDVIDDGAWFTLTIWRKVGKGSQKGSQKSSQKSSQKILDALRQDPNISTMELAEQIGISRRAVAKHIAALQASGALRRIGPDKGGHWEVVCE